MKIEKSLIDIFNLEDAPYDYRDMPWTVENESIYFYDGEAVYQEVLGEHVATKSGLYHVKIDIQQFLGWEDAVFSVKSRLLYANFERKYKQLM